MLSVLSPVCTPRVSFGVTSYCNCRGQEFYFDGTMTSSTCVGHRLEPFMWVSGSFLGFNSDLLCVQSFETGKGAFRDEVVTDPVAGCHTSHSQNLRFISMVTGSVIRINVILYPEERGE
jgi:hypothetical protein